NMGDHPGLDPADPPGSDLLPSPERELEEDQQAARGPEDDPRSTAAAGPLRGPQAREQIPGDRQGRRSEREDHPRAVSCEIPTIDQHARPPIHIDPGPEISLV